ncbi:lipoprotein [Streptomyces laurentii]|uniref:Lipoprotein n=1 Tax=Streptomyces laurentii TaxID=39478 RepID=A0A160P200_STRLU|nr:lipoprotein [Streptomyces laurentii]
MPRTLLRRTAAATAAGSLALLLAACGGSDKPAKDDAKKTDAPASASAAPKADPNAKALSAAELEKLIVEQTDLKGHKVQKFKAGESLAADAVSSDKPECEPLAEALTAVSTGTPGATAQRKAVEIPTKGTDPMAALGAPVTSLALGSYDADGAEKALASLKAAGESCTGGFTIITGGVKSKINKVAADSVTAGDEALAWTVTRDMEGEPFLTKLAVLRKGNNLATFATLSITGEVKEQPQVIIDTQAKKLG